MRRREWILLWVGLALIVGGAVALKQFKARQRLGLPGVKATPVAGSMRMHIEMPTNVPGYEAEAQDVQKVLDVLPSDTSMAQVNYKDSSGQIIMATTVMMGTDRTSIHQPQFCLRGGGWAIDEARSQRTTVHLERPKPVDLPVMKLVSTTVREENGRSATYSGIYVYWFVADDAVTDEHLQRIWWMSQTLLREGVLQRWAYISYFAPCLPGQEDAAFNRIKQLMNATVPEFQLAWPATIESARAAR